MKLTTRMSDPAQIERIRQLLGSRTADLSIEIQQRAVEYGNMFGYDAIRRGVLEQMPAPQIKEEQRVLGEKSTPAKDKRQSRLLKDKNGKKVAKKSESDMLLDLMGGSDVPAGDASATLNGQQNNADLLADILGGGSSISSPLPQTRSPAPPQPGRDSIVDLFNNGTPQTTHTAAASSASTDLLSPSGPTALPVYSKNNLTVTIQISRAAQGASILARFRNTSNFDRLIGVGLQAAVPKSQKLTLQAINRSKLEGGEEATQAMKVVGATGVSLIPHSSLAIAPTHSWFVQCFGLTKILHRHFPQSFD